MQGFKRTNLQTPRLDWSNKKIIRREKNIVWILTSKSVMDKMGYWNSKKEKLRMGSW